MTVLHDSSVMSNAILVGLERSRARSNICSGYDMKEVLVCDKWIPCHFKRIIQRLHDVWEIGTKGKFSDNMGQVHQVMGGMLATSVTVAESSYV